MIRLSMADGSKVHVNPAAIAYIQALPDTEASGDEKRPRTRIVLMTGESLSVRQPPGQILSAAGYTPRRRAHEDESEAGTSGE